MSFEASQQKSLNELEYIERGLITQLLQRVTLEYRDAQRLNEANGGILQGFEAEVSEPTVAFRKNSKKEYIVQDLVRNTRTVEHRTILIYVPQDSDPNGWIDRSWIKTIDENGIEGMHQIDQHGLRIYEPSAEIADDPEVTQALDEIDIDVDTIVFEAIKQKQLAIKNLRELTVSIRDNFETVPFGQK